MSVRLYTKREANHMMENIATNENEQRAIWYGYIANITAYNVQYQENELIDFKTEEAATDEEMEYSTIGGLIYNCYTNGGNIFLENKWLDILIDLQKRENTEE